ncbi:MAG: hypothetical protein J6Z27_01010 [Bacteroidales bacterium]|nr:hypothetical protein [Bacteroidales bacterium]
MSWERLNSSEMTVRGGVSGDWIMKVVNVVVMVLSIIRDYLPSFMKGYKAGRQ